MNFNPQDEIFGRILGMSAADYRRMVNGIDKRGINTDYPYAHVDYFRNSDRQPFRLGQSSLAGNDLMRDMATRLSLTDYDNPRYIGQNPKVSRGSVIASGDGRYIFVHPADYENVKRQLDEIAKNSPLTRDRFPDMMQVDTNYTTTGASKMPDNTTIAFNSFENFQKGMSAAIAMSADVKALHDQLVNTDEEYRSEFRGERLWMNEFEDALITFIRRQPKRGNQTPFSITVEAGKITVFRQVSNGFGFTGKKILEITAQSDNMESNTARVEFKLFNLVAPESVWTFVKP